MGEIAGANIAGQDRRWEQPPGFWSEIGDHQLKYSAWGDGHDTAQLVEGPARRLGRLVRAGLHGGRGPDLRLGRGVRAWART